MRESEKIIAPYFFRHDGNVRCGEEVSHATHVAQQKCCMRQVAQNGGRPIWLTLFVLCFLRST
jgi:hypothetical protein